MRIAVLTKNRLNPAYAGARLGAERAAARAGVDVVHYVPETPDDPVEQSALLDLALAERADAIVLAPVHQQAINDAVARVNAAGVPIVACISRLGSGTCVSFVGADDYALAFNVADYLCRHLGGVGDVVLIDGPAESTTTVPRRDGFRAALAQYPGARVVGNCVGRYLYEPAREEMARLLPVLLRVDAVLAANDLMALGAFDALQAAGRSAAIAGVNAIPAAIEAIKRGDLLVTADFSAMCMGYLAADAAIHHLRGERVPAEVLLPVELVDRSNCSQWDKPYTERLCPDWDAVVTIGTK
jgi:ribose transport system substrate-binding protein